jgi:hypothetical protein
MPPITITLPPQFNTAPAVGLLLIDSIGCERFEEIYCILPTPTPTPTQTPTPTPTPTPTETPTPTPTLTLFLASLIPCSTPGGSPTNEMYLPMGYYPYSSGPFSGWYGTTIIDTIGNCYYVAGISGPGSLPQLIWGGMDTSGWLNYIGQGQYSGCTQCISTPTPTPTPTPTETPTPTPIPCNTYWLFDGGFAGATFEYTDCYGFLQILLVGIASSEYRCGYLLPTPTLISGSGTFSDSGPCPP